MDLNIGLLFIVVELIFIDLSLLAMVRAGYIRLNSYIGSARDGFPPDSKKG